MRIDPTLDSAIVPPPPPTTTGRVIGSVSNDGSSVSHLDLSSTGRDTTISGVSTFPLDNNGSITHVDPFRVEDTSN